MRKATLKDVSKRSGLSIYTVSRTLNGEGGVSTKSQKRVHDAARDLGYVANQAARQLKGSHSSSVAVLTAGTSNTYYLDMLNGIASTLRDTGHTTEMLDIAIGGNYSLELENAMVTRILESRMSGVISALTLTDQSIQLLMDWNVQIVFVDSSPPAAYPNLPSVTTNNLDASDLVGRHLADHGYRDWLFLAYPAIWSSRQDRETGLRRAARNGGATLEVLEVENDARQSEARLRALLAKREKRPDVLIAGNTPLLLGVLGAIKAEGLKVPDDIALVGFDDFAWATFIDPPITVLDERAEEIGRLAARMIDGLIRDARGGTPHTHQHIKVPVDLIVRRSCGCQP
ncbi:Ribose operon repressor [Nereida ignava]|jgi:LacI family transcriptional regulator|uniref:Ribose operon repressor n=2 Tax=Nereida ignava TaxID=282199 RepID=A0A0U1NPR6_9RHOB|nr:Ribose operon repressor [Nereida ignava]SFJ89092.1 LacI family transcriptional regulator [Nereida ignava DSM 16309]